MITLKIEISEIEHNEMYGIELRGKATAETATTLETVTFNVLKPKLTAVLEQIGKDIGASHIVSADKDPLTNRN